MGGCADLLVGFAVLTACGFLYIARSDNPTGWWACSCSRYRAGIFGASVSRRTGRHTRTGHFQYQPGAVTTATSIGAALSNLAAGWIVVVAGYDAAFMSCGALPGPASCTWSRCRKPWIRCPRSRQPRGTVTTVRVVATASPRDFAFGRLPVGDIWHRRPPLHPK